jgi:hypothetical protein
LISHTELSQQQQKQNFSKTEKLALRIFSLLNDEKKNKKEAK